MSDIDAAIESLRNAIKDALNEGGAGEGGGTRRRVNVESNGRSERCGPLRCDTCVRLFFLAAVYVHTHRTERRRKTRKLITDA